MDNKTSEIQKLVEEFFQKAGFEIEIKKADLQDGVLGINLETDSPQVLIGEQGQTLEEIQHLLRMILKRKFADDTLFFDLDIADYKKKKTAYLKEMAKNLADEVALTHQDKELPPMTASERRIIHLELSLRQDVTTESLGEEPSRRIVIKPRTNPEINPVATF